MNRHQLQPSNCRQEFADFLQRLANGADFDTEEWSSFVVAHYHDEALEEIRRMKARMGCGYMDEKLDSEDGRELLRTWADRLRSTSPAAG